LHPALSPRDVSLIIIALNEAQRIGRCLRSVSEMSPPPGEVIFVDNGSSDDTVSIIREWAATLAAPNAVVSEPARGIPYARNAGVRHSRGSVVAFLDADCEAPPDWIEQLLRGFNNTDASAIAGRYALAGDDARAISFRERSWSAAFGWALAGPELMREPRGYVGMTVGGCAAFRKSALEAVGLFDPAFPYCDDIAVSIKLYQYGHRVLRDPAFWATHHLDARFWIIWTKDMRYCRDSVRITKQIMGKRLSVDVSSYRTIARHARTFLTTGDRYYAVEACRRTLLKLATTWFGLRSGCLFL
jgi:glycosyltransferase involved in cell wall biosynthesis